MVVPDWLAYLIIAIVVITIIIMLSRWFMILKILFEPVNSEDFFIPEGEEEIDREFSRLEELFEQGIITENELKYQQEEILKKYSDQ